MKMATDLILPLTLILSISGSGEIITKPEDLSQSMEGEVIFKCEIRKDPGLNMQWELNRNNIYLYNKGHEEYSKNYHNNEIYLVKIDEGKETLTFTLTVKKVGFLNGGTYTCRTVNDEASANLIVLEKPTIKKGAEGENVIYSCFAKFGGPPIASMSSGHCPKLRMKIDGKKWEDSVKKPKDHAIYFQLQMDHKVNLADDMDGKKLKCEIYTENPEKSLTAEETVHIDLIEKPAEVQQEKEHGMCIAVIITLVLVSVLLLLAVLIIAYLIRQKKRPADDPTTMTQQPANNGGSTPANQDNPEGAANQPPQANQDNPEGAANQPLQANQDNSAGEETRLMQEGNNEEHLNGEN